MFYFSFFCVFVTFLACGHGQHNYCPQFWTSHYSCYIIIHNLSPWAAAEEMCKDFRAYLVEVDNEDENNFLKGMIAAEPQPQQRYWIGGTDLLSENAWVWSHSNEEVSYTDWSIGNPSNSGHMENCMEIIDGYNNKTYQWNDNRCSAQNYFICERQPITNPVLG